MQSRLDCATNGHKGSQQKRTKSAYTSTTSFKKIRRIIVRGCPCSQSLTIKMSETIVRPQALKIPNRFAIARGGRSTSHGRRQSKVPLRRWNMFELCANGLTMCREQASTRNAILEASLRHGAHILCSTTSVQQSSNLIKSDLGTQCLHFKRTKLKSMLPDISDCALHNHRVTTKQHQLQKNKKLILCESCLDGQRRLAPRVRVGFWSQLQERRGRVTLVFKCLSTRSRLTPPLTTSCEHSEFTLSAPLGFDTRPHQKQTTSKDAEDFSPELNKASVNVRASFLRTSPLPHEAY